MFIQHIGHAKRVVVLGEMHNTTNEHYDVRFSIETQEHKKILQSYMTNLGIREAKHPKEPVLVEGILHFEYTVKIVNVFNDHEENFSFLGPDMVYLSSIQSFWVDNRKFDRSAFYELLVQAGIPCEEIKYTGNPPQYMPSLILGSWHTENDEVEIEFRDDGTFKIGKSPTSFRILLGELPDRLKGFHRLRETGRWTISDDMLWLSLTEDPPFNNASKGHRVLMLDDNHFHFQFSDYPVIRFVR